MPRGRWGREDNRTARIVRLIVALVLCALFVPVLIGWGRAAVECRMLGGSAPVTRATPQPPAAGPNGPATGAYARPEEQTYLTLPEWYIVYSADEYAAFLGRSQPSQFPYFAAIGQFWQAYFDVCTVVTRDRYPFNSDTHLMLAVIGASFTVENVLKGAYETTIGRAAEWTRSGSPTPEEVYARLVADEYGAFIHRTPWYNFPFWSKVGKLWETNLRGPNLVRKTERRLALTLEYSVKAGYAWLIKAGAESVYAPEDVTIWTRAEALPADLGQFGPEVRVVEATDGKSPLLALPRYEAFTVMMPKLVAQGARFSEIAGNDEIMLTVLAPSSWSYDGGGAEILFTMPILTEQGRTRFALKAPVSSLHTVVGDLTRLPPSDGVTIEHFYDY